MMDKLFCSMIIASALGAGAMTPGGIEKKVAVHGGARGSRGKSVLPCASMRTTVPLNLDHVRRLSVSD